MEKQKKYAQIINAETKVCNVGLGENATFYKSIGMELMDVEKAWDGQWYLQGYAPSKPQPETDSEEIAALQDFLYATDWYVIRNQENGKPIPEEITQQREAARVRISELRGDTV